MHLELLGVTGVLRDPKLVVHRSLPGGGSEVIADNDKLDDSAYPQSLGQVIPVDRPTV